MKEVVEKYKEDFDLLGDPDAIVEYIIDLGKENPSTLEPHEKNDETFIQGCSSPAWMVEECKDGKVHFRVEGSSSLAKGMIPLLLDIFNDRTPQEILSFDPKELNKLGFDKILSPTRLQSMEAFLRRIYGFAKKCKERE
jgi:cysteine desulfuration protein SufE